MHQSTLEISLPNYTTQPWTTTEKLLFRFLFVYFILYAIINHNGVIPFADAISEATFNKVLHTLIPWIGKHILHLSYKITIFTNGSGDTTYDYVLLLFLFAIASVSCVIWTLIDKDRRDYYLLYYWFTTIVRYYVALTMLTYGFVKIYKLQFPFPSVATLTQSYGESSPMRLAWTFMGYSTLYNYFTGFAEVLGGVLLLFRRTTTLGALVSAGVMTNVAMMNYSFDIPVKLLSTTIVIMCLSLLTRDLKRIFVFFILHQNSILPVIEPPVISKRWQRVSVISIKYIFIVYLFFTNINGGIEGLAQYGDDSPKTPLYGIYYVDKFIKNKDTLALTQSDTTQWHRLVVGKYNRVNIQFMNDSLRYFAFEPDTLKKKFTLTSNLDTNQKHTFVYLIPKKDQLWINGNWQKDSVQIHFKKFDTHTFRLINTGFHWINEYPNNR